jgi:hypothetical protein
MQKDFQEKLDEIKNLVEMQGATGTWDATPYMQGMFNGMELLLSILEERDPEFRMTVPKEGAEKKVNEQVEKLGESINKNIEAMQEALNNKEEK